MNTEPQLSIMALLVCRNRRDTTLAAIERIKLQKAPVRASIAVFDDASTDGTPEAVSAAYPDVRIVKGDGNAFWNGGLHRLWSAVRDEEVDAFLWLNDDSWLDDDAFDKIADGWNEMTRADGDKGFILVGSTRGTDGEISYGGLHMGNSRVAFRMSRAYPKESGLVPISTFNGNVVLVSKGAVGRIGLNDPYFFHNLGDVDYGLRATQAGIPVMLLPGTVGYCEANAAKSQRGYGAPTLSVQQQWRKVNTHHGLPFRDWLYFTRRHSGRNWLLHFVTPYRHLLRFWRLKA